MAITITITADTQEEAITQINGLSDLVSAGAKHLYFHKGTPRGSNGLSMVKTDTGNDYILGGALDVKKIPAEKPQEAPESDSKTEVDNSTPKTKEAPQSPTVPAEKDDKKSGATAKDVKKLLLLLAKATPSHKDDVKELMNSFSAANFRSFEQLTKERDDGEAMMQSAYDKAKALAEKYDLLEEAS